LAIADASRGWRDAAVAAATGAKVGEVRAMAPTTAAAAGGLISTAACTTEIVVESLSAASALDTKPAHLRGSSGGAMFFNVSVCGLNLRVSFAATLGATFNDATSAKARISWGVFMFIMLVPVA
jgi:hypothetical protein